MKHLLKFVAVCLAFLAGVTTQAVAQTTNVHTNSTSWICPAGVTFVQVQCWGAGGAGGSAQRNPDSSNVQFGGGGAGGAYAKVSSYSVTPGNTYYINVGIGGANSSSVNDTTVPGGDSWFNSVNSPSATIIAKGGAGGASRIGNTSAKYGGGGTGTPNGSVGDVVYAGGSGATANITSGTGGGGSSAGTGTNGTAATSNVGASAPAGGGSGGTGPTYTVGTTGGSGSTPGGGGSGARGSSITLRTGGSGAAGQVILIYTAGGGSSGVSATAAAPIGNRSGTGGLMVPEGRDITLTETPSAGTAPFTYAWKKVGSGTVLGTNSTILISSPTNGDQYTCDVAATWDGVTNTSPAATITALPFITVMGSSVALGVGSTPSTTLTNGSRINGYAGLLTALLTPQGWMVTNISIGGQDTIDALARFTPDLVPIAPNYVLLGYSLANEGLPGSTNPAAVVTQFTNNMTTLIGQCRSNGISPVIGLCYPEADYTLSEYGYIKSVNQTINNWNVPSINLLGALDDGNGQWVDGYWYDVKHPNNAGHQEFFYSIVPTLFDALHAGKTNSPRLAVATQFARLTQDGAVSAPLTFTPSNTMHSFTVSFRVRSTDSGTIAAIRTGASYATLEIRADRIVYVSTNGQEILSSVNATNGDWNDIALTYRYAQTNTSLIVNGALAGTLMEQYVPDQFTLGGPAGASGRPASPLVADYQNWCVYRSAWNIDEARAHIQGNRQQASMEICATLDDTSFTSGTSASNQAQSLSLAMVNTANFTPMVQNVSSPSGLSAQAGTGLVVNLTWTRNSTTESGFVVERRLAGTTAWSDLVLLPAGSVSYTDSDIVPGGDYDYRVSAIEDGLRGNYSNTASVSFADILTVSLTAPTNGASFTAPASIALTANASSLTGTITTVDFYNGAILLGSDTTSPYACTWTNVASGSYNLTARSADDSGTVRTSAVTTVTVVDPTYTLTVTSGGGSGSYTNGAQVAIMANSIPGKSFVQWTGDVAYVNNVTYTNALVTMSTNAVGLTATYTNSASFLSVDFESDTVSNSPTLLGAIARPSPSTVSNYVTVVDSSGNKAGTGQGVRFCDIATNVGTALEYNFVADAASQISLVQASFDFSCLASSSGSGYISVGLGAYSAVYSMSAASARWNELRLYQDNTLKPTLNGSTTGQGTFTLNPAGTANTLVMFVNDSAAPVDYTFNGAQTLAADTVVYWLNGTKIATLVLDNEVTNTVNNFGKIGFCAGTAAAGIDYAIDNIVVAGILPPANVSATAVAPTGSGTGTGGLTVGEGSSITLTETPSAGTAPFTYAWKKVGAGDVLGTNSTLLISSPTNGAQYTCDVAATWDGVTNTSPAATLSVLPLVSATAAAPTGNGSGTGGMTVYAQRTRMTLTETPSGGTAPFSYAWKKVGSGTVLGTNSTLTISPLVNGDQYVCDVASLLDGVTNTSPAATLTVTSVLNSNKIVFIKADDVRVINWYSPAWTNFIVASGNLGIKIGLGIIATNITDASASTWLRAKDATGEVEFWDHGWDHTQWDVVNGSTTTTVSEFEGSGLAYMRQHLADAQSNIFVAVGRNAIAFGTGYNGFDTNTAAVINETPALRLLFTRDLALAASILTSRVALVDIISENGGTGKPDAALFKAAYPNGPTGPISLQHHPANFDSTGVTQYMAIVEHLLTNGYAFLTPSEYIALSDPPAASFSASPTNSGAPLTVTFTDTSTGVITNRYWNFGDGATTNVTATSLTHTYSFPGTNTVTLIVSGANGSSTNVRANLIVVTSETMVTRTNVTVFAAATNWTCPANVTSIQVECWGAGGAGGSARRDPATGSIQYGGGGAGGAYAKVNSYSVTPGNTYYINVGAGGANSSTNNGATVAGGDSWFNSVNSPSATLIAKGGAGGQSAVGNTSVTAYGPAGTGTATGSAGDVVYAGGSGAAGAASAAGGGGSSAGTGANGTAAISNMGATAPAGGGDGGTGPTTSSGNGGSGSVPGGGGAGARASTIQSGGTGAAGQVILSYTTTSVGVSAAAATPTGNGSGTGGWTTYAQRTRITLTETPSAGTGPFTYAWKKVGSGTVIGTNSSLVVSSPVNGDQYTCDVAATWDGVTNTSPTATLTVTTVIDPNKVAFIKADAFRALGPAWTNFLVASRDLGIKVNIGPICTNNIDSEYAIAQPASYQNTTNWMQTQQAMGDVEFFQYGWTHTTWLDTNGVTIYEYNGSGLAFQQDNFAKAQAALSNALGRSAITFGPSFNQVDADTATVLNAAPEIKLFFVSSTSIAQTIGLDPRVAVAPIYNETSYGEGVGLPNAAIFKAAFPGGPPGPAALQFHPSDPSFDAYRVAQYTQIVQHLLTNGYAILLPSEYVASMPVYASFSASPTNGGAPLTVTFIDSSLGTPTNRYWSFGDGTTANVSATSLTHTYSLPGTNTVRLIVRDASGSSTNTKTALIIAASVDTVGDGAPDWWRAQYFGGNGATTNADSSATADFDHDGISNLAEYLADTNPTNAASRLAVTSLTIVSNQVRLVWTGGSSAWQIVEYRNSLTDTNGWKAVYTNTPPTAVTNMLFDTGAGSATSRFYRIKAWR